MLKLNFPFRNLGVGQLLLLRLVFFLVQNLEDPLASHDPVGKEGQRVHHVRQGVKKVLHIVCKSIDHPGRDKSRPEGVTEPDQNAG